MEKHREDFFLATKTRSRSYKGAWRDLERSLKRLRVDQIDLWQMHGLTNPQGWKKAMGSGGTLEAFIEARDKGLVRYLGVTGHGIKVQGMHLQSIQTFDFDSVLLPYNYALMQNPRYAKDFEKLVLLCRERHIAIQTIKSIAWRPWADRPKTHNTYFYEPFDSQDAIDLAVHWAMGFSNSFVITAGDIGVLPHMLEAASRFIERPPDAEMDALVERIGVQPIFT
jgi:predicted aldo/keto reductase-like oxidoreductase